MGLSSNDYTTLEKNKLASLENFSKDYNELINKPTIPDITNLATKTELTNGLGTKADVSHLQEISSIINLQTALDDRYPKNETMSKEAIQILFNSISKNMNWKAPIDTLVNLQALTGMAEGDAHVVTENSTIYIYSNSAWVSLGSSASVPMATETIDGLLSKEDKIKLNAIVVANLITDTKLADELAKYTNTTTLEANYAKKSDLTVKANANDVYTQTQTDNLLNNKVDKVADKSLIADSEITRLSTVTNYNDTTIKADLNKKLEATNIKAGSNITVTTSGNDVVINSTATGTGGSSIDDSNVSTTTTYSSSKIKQLIDNGASFEVVSTLPSSPSSLKIYILSSNFSLNYYDGSWHLLGGSDQISKGTTAPTDTNKLWLDTTSTPILKYYNGTTWVSISSSSSQIQSDWNQTDNTKADYIKNKPTSFDATSINNILVNDSTRSNGSVLTYNNVTNNLEYADINVTGIIGSSQITNVGNMIDIASGEEKTFVHTATTDENIIINVQEQIQASSVTDTHVDFSDNSKYVFQDIGKMLLNSNKAQLDIYTKALFHMNSNSFTDECGHVVTNNGVTLDTINYVFGSGSAYFSGSNYLSVSNFTDFNFLHQVGTSGKWTIDYRIKLPNTISNIMNIFDTTNSSGSGSNGIIINMNTDYTMSIFICKGTSGTYFINATTTNKVPNDNSFHHIEITYDQSLTSNNLCVYIDGILINSFSKNSSLTASTNNCTSFIIGKFSTTYYFKGNIDEFRISKDIVRNIINFIPSIQEYNPYLISNVSTYLQTTGSSDYSLTTIDSITSFTIPVTTPTNTSIKCLFSVDNKTNWLYKDETGIHKYTGDLTQTWISSNSNTELQTYFTNLSITQLTSDLSSIGIVPVSLDLAFQLATTDITITPFVSAITMIYNELPHTELASFGSYEEQYVKFGVKRINSSTLGVKNNTSKSRKINVNVCIKTS